MLVPVLLFLLGFVLLIKGGDWFVDGAVGIAHRFHLPELLIGATVVSIGTTLPEVMVSSQAAILGNSGISYGNAIGSVICNTALIAALTAAIRPCAVNRSALKIPVSVFFLAAALYAIFAYTFGAFSRWMGILFLFLFLLYLILTARQMKAQPEDVAHDAVDAEEVLVPFWKHILFLVIGAACIAFGANLLVENGTLIAAALGVPDSVIGLTMVALGTSLPELITAITSLAKGHNSLSLGNVIGANIFNILLVSGTAITISPFTIPSEKLLFGRNASLVLDIPLMLAVMAILCLPAIKNGKLKRWQGVLLLTVYFAFTIFQFLH